MIILTFDKIPYNSIWHSMVAISRFVLQFWSSLVWIRVIENQKCDSSLKIDVVEIQMANHISEQSYVLMYKMFDCDNIWLSKNDINPNVF